MPTSMKDFCLKYTVLPNDEVYKIRFAFIFYDVIHQNIVRLTRVVL